MVKLKNVKKGVKVGLGVAKATAKLGKQIMNPKYVYKSAKKAVKGEGFILPGTKYIGPMNRMDLGKPTGRGDAVAYQHDKDYDNLLKKGAKKQNVYLGYSKADKRALKRGWKLAKKGNAGGLAVAAGMGAKALLHKTGLTKKFSKGVRKYE